MQMIMCVMEGYEHPHYSKEGPKSDALDTFQVNDTRCFITMVLGLHTKTMRQEMKRHYTQRGRKHIPTIVTFQIQRLLASE